MRVRRFSLTFLAVLSAVQLAACARRVAAPTPQPTPQPARISEQALPGSPVRIEIVDLHETPSGEPGRVRVVGTIVNRGGRTTRELRVKLTVYDAKGKVLAAVAAVPSSEVIEADGGAVTFAATIDDRREIKDYEVEALAR